MTTAASRLSALPTFLHRRCSRAERSAARALENEYKRLWADLNAANRERIAAESVLNRLTDAKAIDVCIFRLQAATAQYENLLHQIRTVQQRLLNLAASSGQYGGSDI